MEDSTRSNRPTAAAESIPDRAARTESQLTQITNLLKELEAAPALPVSPEQRRLSRAQESELVQVRLGIASALYRSLEARHEPTARHCLRVSMGCSAWATKIDLEENLRDDLELAALLHDIGKVGVPDSVLLKPGTLSPEEMSIVEQHWQHGLSILKTCCCNQAALEIVRHTRTWFDGSRGKADRQGEQLPLGSRMLAIVDAFDAMLTDQVYRKAMPLEMAFNELLRYAGSQFDPALVVLFIKLYEADQFEVHENVARRWLQELHPEHVQSAWKHSEVTHWNGGRDTKETLFQQKLLDNMHDAVVFIDNASRIMLWNRAAERMTGIPTDSMLQRMFLPSVLRLRDDKGRLIKDDDCPVAHTIQTGVQWLKRLMIRGRSGKEIPVDAHAMPVINSEGLTLGITLLLHDASPEISLEERCQNLHEIATRDPLTQIANRAEFDRVHGLFVDAHQESKRPCSMLICDIDRFKRINDTFGHQAGDAIIQSFAKVLQNAAHPGDLVARYGGEEFVMLSADCDTATAARRAEEIRITFCELRQPTLNSQTASASFGVTSIQPGDTPETMLRRADRALLLAKETGRNKVVQLGSGSNTHDEPGAAAPRCQQQKGSAMVSHEMISQSPIDRTIDKLRGFIADQHGELVAIDGHSVQIKLGESFGLFFRRAADRQVPLIIDLRFEEDMSDAGEGRARLVRTRIFIDIRPQRNRDRRQVDTLNRARQLVMSLRSYLMATDVTSSANTEALPDTPFTAQSKGGFFSGLFGRKAPEVDDRR